MLDVNSDDYEGPAMTITLTQRLKYLIHVHFQIVLDSDIFLRLSGFKVFPTDTTHLSEPCKYGMK